jgi:hypothetical protein
VADDDSFNGHDGDLGLDDGNDRFIAEAIGDEDNIIGWKRV